MNQPSPDATPPAAQSGRFMQPSEGSAVSGMFQDPSTLAATGLIAAVLLAVGAGVINFIAADGLRARLMALTDTVDVGDVALLGIAVLLLLVTPDPPGGIERSLLLRANAVLALVIAAYGILRSLLLLTEPGVTGIVNNVEISAGPSLAGRLAGFLATLGVAFAASTIGFYASKESFLKKEGRI